MDHAVGSGDVGGEHARVVDEHLAVADRHCERLAIYGGQAALLTTSLAFSEPGTT